MKRIFKRLHTAPTKGQSMVEMAIITPILIFFLIGIFEVGWALRNYLVLVNINREITRFAIRPGYMDFSTESKRADSYEEVRNWAETVASDQLGLDFDETSGSSTLIISHLVIDTGKPCEDMSTCDCNWFDPEHGDYDPSQAFTIDDIIIHPGNTNYEYQTETYGITETVTGPRNSRLNYDSLATQLKDQNNRFNCEIIKKGGLASANNLVATEMFHDQPQLFGFPVISNPFTDPVPLYTHTVMRLIGGARSTGGVEGSLIAGIDAIGEVCFAYPFIVSKAQLDGSPPVNTGSLINILDEGASGSHKGWVAWDEDKDSEVDLMYELQYPQMSVNGYDEPGASTDQTLDPGDGVASLSGGHLGQVRILVEALQGQEIIVPVWSSFNSGVYTVDRFIRVNIQGVSGSTVTALYLGDAPEACNSPEL